MNFHSTTAPRIREIYSTSTVKYRITSHYSDTNCVVGVNDTMVVVKNVKEVIKA